jgi:exonuclease SbcC
MLADVAERLVVVVRRQEQLPDERRELSAELAELTTLAAGLESVDRELPTAEARLEAAIHLPSHNVELARLEGVERDARDAAADARAAMLTVIERRLAGMAAELAGRLEDGLPCQVCGSIDHPMPATTAADAVTELDQQRASQTHDQLAAAHRQATRRVEAAARDSARLQQASAGLSPDDAQRAVAELTARRAAALAADKRRDTVTAQIKGLHVEQDDLASRSASLHGEAARLRQSIAAAEETIAGVELEIDAALGADASTGSIVEGLGPLREGLLLVSAAADAVEAAEAAGTRRSVLAGRAESLVRELGIASLDEARAAVLEPAERAAREELLHAREEARARALLILDDPEVAAVDGLALPDLAASEALLADAVRSHNGLIGRLHEQQQTMGSLRDNLARLEKAVVAWAPVTEESGRAESMARLVRGTGSENHLQMRLSAYVLATRLDQVLAAANERLGHLRDQRYLLQRTGRASRRGAQAGLGLEVVDEWTGDVRDPSTLSGGETFVVSLSLALGLADVVTQEVGGAEIETLFVDEGFGMLDADTLDDVMDHLDSLRAGGRTVGVVSHVSELRNRIPTQVHIEKGRTGSSIAVRTMVA